MHKLGGTGAKTVVRTAYCNSNCFEVIKKVNMHQVSFSIESNAICDCHEALSREFRVALPWKLLYADDLVVIAESISPCISPCVASRGSNLHEA